MTGGVAPTARVAQLLAAVAVLAVLVPLPVTAALTVLLAVAVAGDAAGAVSARPTGGRPDVPTTMRRGRPVALTPATAPGAQVHQPGSAAFEVGGDGWTVTPRRRGRHELPAARAVVTGRLRLARWVGPLGEPTAVTVLPAVAVGRRSARTALRLTRYDDEGGRVLGPLGLGTAFEALRTYLPDDDVRLVNWRATERFGEPIVNQYRLELSREVLVAVDCGRTARGTTLGGEERLDGLVDAAATVALAADAVGDRCGLLAYADGPLAELAPRTGGGVQVVRRLATVEAQAVAGDPRAALTSIGRKRLVIVLLTQLLDPAAAAILLDSVPVASRRHRIVIVSPIDPDLTAAMADGGTSSTAALRAAAASELLADAESVAHQLRRAGASVTLVPVDRLSAMAVDAYLSSGSRAPRAATTPR